jgi:hypothetical protein
MAFRVGDQFTRTVPEETDEFSFTQHACTDSPCGKNIQMCNGRWENILMTFQDQFARVRRSLARVENSSVNPQLELPPEKQTEYEDMLFTFFQNCWHLKDWIKNDSAAPRSLAGPIEQLCRRYQSLPLAADVANGTKHLRLDNPRLGARVVPEIMVRLTDSFVTGESTSQVRYVYKISDDRGNSFDALTVARQAVSDWETLITTNGGTI